MGKKSKISAILIAAITLSACEPETVFADPDEPVTQKEFHEYKQQQIAEDGLNFLFILLLFWLAITIASAEATSADNQHKIDEHGFIQS